MNKNYFSALFVLYPYLTIHMRELGINVEETAIMSAVTPFVAIVMPPLAGLIADRIGNFKVNKFSLHNLIKKNIMAMFFVLYHQFYL